MIFSKQKSIGFFQILFIIVQSQTMINIYKFV